MGTLFIMVVLIAGAVIAFKILKKHSTDNNPSASAKRPITQNQSPVPSSVSFLEELPVESSWAGFTGDRSDPFSILNFSAELNARGNNKDAVRCLNHALKMSNLSCEILIPLHRNRAHAIASHVGFGSGRKPYINLDYCIAAEHILQDTEEIIGIYVTNEKIISDGRHAEFLHDCFHVALANFMPVGLSIGAYQDGHSYHMYSRRIPERWKICFVHEPKNALSVNGIVYPQYIMPK